MSIYIKNIEMCKDDLYQLIKGMIGSKFSLKFLVITFLINLFRTTMHMSNVGTYAKVKSY
jgi:hypothetical protein